MKREYRDFAEDMLTETERILEFVHGMTIDEFRQDYKTTYAVFKALENIGEAAKKIPLAIRKKYPAIPFKEMAGMRDILSHEYFGINHMVVWNVVNKKLPPLVRNLREMVRDIDDAQKTISDFFKKEE